MIYSGFFPFVGSGYPLGGWSFPVNISRAKEVMGKLFEIKSFELSELYDAVDQAINKCNFEGFVSKDVLFANGQQIREEKWILPSIFSYPVHHVDEETIKSYLSNNDPRVRHYKWMQVFDWGNELVISYFLRLSIRGEYLFVEVNHLLLTPLAEQYRRIDTILPPTKSTFVGMIFGSLFVGPFVAIFGALSAIGRVLGAIGEIDWFGNKRRSRENEIKKNLLFDYGTDTSMRQETSSLEYNHYFQLLDKEMYVKVFEKQILEALITFLEDHNIETSDIKERQTTILNTGLIVQGGEVSAESLAVGEKAEASVSKKSK